MAEIKEGSTVRLRSGGPKMTVNEIGLGPNEMPTAWCAWFDGNKTVRDSFPIHSLKDDNE